MYTLEFRAMESAVWLPWEGRLDREEAIGLLRSAQVSDAANDIGRFWRITPNPWEGVA